MHGLGNIKTSILYWKKGNLWYFCIARAAQMSNDKFKCPVHFVEIQRIHKTEDRVGLDNWHFKGRLFSSIEMWKRESQRCSADYSLEIKSKCSVSVWHLSYNLYYFSNVFEATILCLVCFLPQSSRVHTSKLKSLN